MIQVKKFTFNPVSVNAFVLWDETGEAVVADPACYYADEEDELAHFVAQQGLKVVHILNTHGHFDHLMGNDFAAKTWDLVPKIHAGDAFMASQAREHASFFGIAMTNPVSGMETITEGEVIIFGQSGLKVIHVPGHSPGGVAYYSEADGILVAGDILFEGSVGRTDLPGGNHALLIGGIREKLLTLPGDTIVYCGHGRETTLGREKRMNPFLQG